MSKFLFTTVLFLLGWSGLYGQSMAQYVEYADENMAKGDFYNAIIHYRKAMNIDSTSVLLNWKIAEAYRKYKDYGAAEYYYHKVYRKEDAKMYPYSIFWLATMQKMNGKYKESLDSWRSAKRVYLRDRKSYLYKKSNQEYKSAAWAKKAVKDTLDISVESLPGDVNTFDSEFAPAFNDSTLYFTSMKGDSSDNKGIIYYSDKYRLEVFSSKFQDSSFTEALSLEDLNVKHEHTANGTWTKGKDRFYFTRCNDSLKCKIYVARYNGSQFSDVDVLGDIVNDPESNTTMPYIVYKDGSEYLLFVSDRKGSIGGLDLWYSEVTDRNKYKKPENFGKKINTLDDDITPFYDEAEDKLFFSSTWHEGFGGMDIFYVEKPFSNDMGDPVNLGIPYNSSQNDTYFFKDSETEFAFFSSNRTGTLSHKSPNCCNDIFWIKPEEKPVVVELTPEETLDELNKRLPVTLYFHNDEPNPKTRDSITKLNYMTTYYEYKKLKNDYQKEYSSGLQGEEAEDAIEDIEEFYVDYVDQGVQDLEVFTKLLIKELQKGLRVKVNVKGFASPLAKTDYNVNLTMRRISSLVNYLREHDNGIFIPYLEGNAENGGKLEIKGVPFGEYRADRFTSDNFHDQRNSVYSRAAMIERKIEIQSVQLIEDEIIAEPEVDKAVKDFGYIKETDVMTHVFKITNRGKKDLEFLESEVPCECTSSNISTSLLKPGETASVEVTFNPKGFKGLQYRDVKIKTNGVPEYITLTVTAHIID